VTGVAELLNEIVGQIPAPTGDAEAPARALIFDSVYDTYRGVVTYVRVVDGKLTHRDRIKMMSTGAVHEMLEVGVISPEPVKAKEIGVGEVGYLITGVKEVRQSRVGDTVTWQNNGATEPLSGYKHPNPMVFAGLYPIDGDDYPTLRDALDKLQLNDAALAYEPETSGALGFGFRIGFLGLLHMEIVRERLEREFNLDLISTAPNVVYRVVLESGEEVVVTNPSEYPTSGKIAAVYEPVVRATILSPDRLHRHHPRAVPEPPRCPARAWTTCRPTGWRSATPCRWPRSSSTSSTPSSPGPRATPASTTSPTGEEPERAGQGGHPAAR
jgi:GTP-binding protein LepA